MRRMDRPADTARVMTPMVVPTPHLISSACSMSKGPVQSGTQRQGSGEQQPALLCSMEAFTAAVSISILACSICTSRSIFEFIWLNLSCIALVSSRMRPFSKLNSSRWAPAALSVSNLSSCRSACQVRVGQLQYGPAGGHPRCKEGFTALALTSLCSLSMSCFAVPRVISWLLVISPRNWDILRKEGHVSFATSHPFPGCQGGHSMAGPYLRSPALGLQDCPLHKLLLNKPLRDPLLVQAQQLGQVPGQGLRLIPVEAHTLQLAHL